jgi:hypothetical protein
MGLIFPCEITQLENRPNGVLKISFTGHPQKTDMLATPYRGNELLIHMFAAWQHALYVARDCKLYAGLRDDGGPVPISGVYLSSKPIPTDPKPVYPGPDGEFKDCRIIEIVPDDNSSLVTIVACQPGHPPTKFIIKNYCKHHAHDYLHAAWLHMLAAGMYHDMESGAGPRSCDLIHNKSNEILGVQLRWDHAPPCDS